MAESLGKNVEVAVAAPPGTCLLCHTVDYAVTEEGLEAGGFWKCQTCGQTWDVRRLTAATEYAVSQAAR
jgi:transposase-like protein